MIIIQVELLANTSSLSDGVVALDVGNGGFSGI